MKAILKKSDAKEPFTFSFVDGSGKMLVRSENYAARKNAVNGIESVKTNCADQSRYAMEEARNGKLYFNLKAANGQIVATSAMFDSASDRDAAVQSLMSDGGSAAIDDQAA